MTVIEFLGSIGAIAGVMSLFIFFSYRYLVNQMRQDRKFMEDRLTKVISDYNDSCRLHAEALREQTKMCTELTTWLKIKNGSCRD